MKSSYLYLVRSMIMFICRDLVDLDTPHSWKGVKQFQGNFEECKFSGLEVVSGNNEVRKSLS